MNRCFVLFFRIRPDYFGKFHLVKRTFVLPLHFLSIKNINITYIFLSFARNYNLLFGFRLPILLYISIKLLVNNRGEITDNKIK